MPFDPRNPLENCGAWQYDPLTGKPLDQLASALRGPGNAFSDADMRRLLSAIYRQGALYDQPFTVGVTAARLLAFQETRTYLFIQNQSPTDNLLVRFGSTPSFSGGLTTAGNGVLIPANFGTYEPLVVPVGEIWVIGAAAGVPGILLYAV